MDLKDIDFGPLSALIGKWEGDRGLDISPEPDGEKRTEYHETIVFEPVGGVKNAEKQTLYAVRYLQRVVNKSTGEVFHDETGYWMYDPAEDIVMHSLLIPRGVGLIAGGKYERRKERKDEGGEHHEEDTIYIRVEAIEGGKWGVIQSPFMYDNARTVKFVHELWVSREKLKYKEITSLFIYGRNFEHIDENVLRKVE